VRLGSGMGEGKGKGGTMGRNKRGEVRVGHGPRWAWAMAGAKGVQWEGGGGGWMGGCSPGAPSTGQGIGEGQQKRICGSACLACESIRLLT